jgi:integrase
VDVQAYIAKQIESGTLAPKTVNNIIALLKQMLKTAVDWGYLTAVPLTGVKKLRRPRRDAPLWTPTEIRTFLFEAPEEWAAVWLVGIFTGLRPGEIQAMSWDSQNCPDFTTNKIRVTCAYEAESKVLGPTKTDRSVRLVDMVPAVRHALLDLPSRAAGGLIFPGSGGGMFSRSNMKRAWQRTITVTGVRRIRPYDLRHTFASLLIMAGKNPLYVARQMGHYSAGFTLDTYGHLMEALPKRQVEWIDELVFPEGWETFCNQQSLRHV